MFQRIISLIGEDNFTKIQNKKILIVGLGGVGGACLEALVRSGITDITIIDFDKIDSSNLNRQLMSNEDNIGLKKVNVWKDRLLKINHLIKIKAIDLFLEDELVLTGDYDYIIDACDTVKTKILLMNYAIKNNIFIISSMGTGKRMDPTKLKITTLNKTYNDPLAKVVRAKAKKENLPLNIPVVFSSELPINTENCIGSMIFVPASAGLLIANYIINDIIKQ